MYLGSSYNSVLNLQKRVECGVIERMKEKGGHVLSRFVKKGKSIYLSVDNIDFLEGTAYGQNTLHGPLVVINQEENENGEPVNNTLAIPDKPWPVCIDVGYRDEPVKFDTYNINEGADLLIVYQQKDRIWALGTIKPDKSVTIQEKS